MKQGQFPAVLPLGSLNGQNGFKIDGENNNDQSGISVSAAGDINDDGYADLLIGAEGYPAGSYKGRSYVLFGGPDVGSAGTISLSSLSGTKGFKLDGENNSDRSGLSVSAAGDINGDGYDDLIIGAPLYPANNAKGRSYVVFGGSGVGNTGIISLASLNGTNGFKFEGINKDQVGYALKSAGDLDQDGYTDLVFGAFGHGGDYTGCVYVVFGGPKVGTGGLILASNLNGINGFTLSAESAGSQTGRWVNAAGDINGDHYADLLIGAPLYNNDMGRSYVVFGHTELGKEGTLPLSMLNGSNGFKLTGEMIKDNGGMVNGLGDVNGDGYDDLLIGANNHNNGVGRNYVIFGGLKIGISGEVLLSDLNGMNGFKIDGEAPGDHSGSSNASPGPVGDINGDGYADIPISAYGHNSNTGRSYILFGGPQIGGNGLLSLSNLDGVNGFKMDGEKIGDYSGSFSVTGAGDINSDKVADLLVGAWGYPSGSYKGRSYVVFGDIPPVLVNNSLPLYANETVLINSNHLASYDRNHDNNTLVFIPSNITHGRFELTSNPGKVIANFTQQQITAGEIQFVPDGTTEAPSYNITVRTTGIAYVSETPANITFNLLQIKNNQLLINQGQTVVLATENLSATDTGSQEENIEFIIGDLQHGQFQWTNFTDQPILTFKQQNITDGAVSFVHDGSDLPPCYNVSVSNGKIIVGPQASLIDFDALPVILNNILRIDQGESVVLNSAILSATHLGGDDANLIFMISSVQHSNFSVINASAQPLFSFYQQNITDRQIRFNHDNSVLAPAYSVYVTDGRASSPAQSALIDFDAIPVLENNTLVINQGQQVILNAEILSASHATGEPNALLFNISDVQHGQFSFVNSPTQAITNFYQKNIADQSIQFSHDIPHHHRLIRWWSLMAV